jgi:hypothetical protein
VRAVLQQQGLPYVEEQAREIIVVPVLRDAQGAPDQGAGARAWMDAWKGLDLEHTLAPIELQSLKPSIHPDTLKALVDGKGGTDRILADEYGRPYVVVAIGDYDAGAKRFNITLSGLDAVGSLYLKRSYHVADGDTGYAMELAAVIAQGVLEGRWKAIKTAGSDPAQGQAISLQARYQSFDEWREMRRQLLAIPGIGDMRVDSETAQGATVTLRYAGGPAELAGALSGHGLAIESGADGLIIRSGYQP